MIIIAQFHLAQDGLLFDITSDTNAPSTWNWTLIDDLDINVQYYKSGAANVAYVGEVEIRVTYTDNPPTVTALNYPANNSWKMQL